MKLYQSNKQWLLLSVWLISLLFYPLEGASSSRIEHKIIKLADLMLVNEQINLRNTEDSYSFTYSLSRRVRLHKVRLHLDFTHSNVLLKGRSQLVVLVNGVVAKQFMFDAQKTHNVSDIMIPTEYFIDGYNKITLAVAQHYTLQCEVPESAELWTQINSVKSYLAIDADYSNIDYTLADLNDLIDKKLPKYEVALLLANSHYHDNALQWGSLVTQGIALRLEYKSFKTTLAKTTSTNESERLKLSKNDPLRFLQQSKLTSDAVLIGTVNELAGVLAPEIKNKISGAFLGIYPARNKRYHVIVIAGTTAAEVTQAATAFAYVKNSFPDTQDMLIQELTPPLYLTQTKLGSIIPGQTYSFNMLGFSTHTMSYKNKYSELSVNMPSDLYHELKSVVNLKLDFNYGAAFRPDSVLNIRVNGIFEKAIILDNKYGESHQGYAITIPSRVFIPGLNKLSFEAVVPPLVSGDCTLIQSNNSLVTLFDSSSIHFPELDHYARLPDLTLMQRTGFPYLNSLAGDELGIVLRDKKNATILGAWKLIAKLSQINGAPLPAAQLSFSTINNRHLFIIGARSSLHTEDFINAPVQLSNGIQFPYSAGYVAEVKQRSAFEYLENFLFAEEKAAITLNLVPVHAKIKVKAGLGEYVLMMSYPAAESDGLLNTLITYEDAGVFSNNMEQLVQPEMWGGLSHNIAIWKNDKQSLEILDSGDEFYIGKTTLRNKLAYYFSIHHNYWLVMIIAILLAIAFVGHLLLNRYKLKHHGDIQEYDSSSRGKS